MIIVTYKNYGTQKDVKFALEADPTYTIAIDTKADSKAKNARQDWLKER